MQTTTRFVIQSDVRGSYQVKHILLNLITLRTFRYKSKKRFEVGFYIIFLGSWLGAT